MINDSLLMKINTATEEELTEIGNAISRRRYAIRENVTHQAAKMLSETFAFMIKNNIAINFQAESYSRLNPKALYLTNCVVSDSVFDGLITINEKEEEIEDEDE